jgi:hypothetical protein
VSIQEAPRFEIGTPFARCNTLIGHLSLFSDQRRGQPVQPDSAIIMDKGSLFCSGRIRRRTWFVKTILSPGNAIFNVFFNVLSF